MYSMNIHYIHVESKDSASIHTALKTQEKVTFLNTHRKKKENNMINSQNVYETHIETIHLMKALQNSLCALGLSRLHAFVIIEMYIHWMLYVYVCSLTSLPGFSTS